MKRIAYSSLCLLIGVSLVSAAEQGVSPAAKGSTPPPMPFLMGTNNGAGAFGPGAPGKGGPSPMAPELSAEYKKLIEFQQKMEEINKQIVERKSTLCQTHPSVVASNKQMMELQKEVNKIMDSDTELAELKMKRDILFTTMPVLPKPPVPEFKGAPANLMAPQPAKSK